MQMQKRSPEISLSRAKTLLTATKVKILTEGREEPNRFNPEQNQHIFGIETKNGAKDLNFNQTSLNALIDAFGEESKNWVGKVVNIIMVKQNVSGNFTDVVYVAPDGYAMTENGLTNTAPPEQMQAHETGQKIINNTIENTPPPENPDEGLQNMDSMPV